MCIRYGHAVSITKTTSFANTIWTSNREHRALTQARGVLDLRIEKSPPPRGSSRGVILKKKIMDEKTKLLVAAQIAAAMIQNGTFGRGDEAARSAVKTAKTLAEEVRRE